MEIEQNYSENFKILKTDYFSESKHNDHVELFTRIEEIKSYLSKLSNFLSEELRIKNSLLRMKDNIFKEIKLINSNNFKFEQLNKNIRNKFKESKNIVKTYNSIMINTMFRFKISKMNYYKNIKKMQQIFLSKTQEKTKIFKKLNNYQLYFDNLARKLFQSEAELKIVRSSAEVWKKQKMSYKK